MAGVARVLWYVPNAPIFIVAHGFTDDKVREIRLFVRFERRARKRILPCSGSILLVEVITKAIDPHERNLQFPMHH